VALAAIDRPGFSALYRRPASIRVGGTWVSVALRQIQGIRADLALSGVCAADAQTPVDPRCRRVVLKRTMIEASGETVWSPRASSSLRPRITRQWKACTHLVVERGIDAAIIEHGQAAGTSVHIA
jgi:DeoR/GlpR family transcriptional regulator of sugar metabolism